jgi:hypothetical protein
MAHKVYYPAYDYWKEELQPNFEIILNPLLDDLGRRVTLSDLQEFLTAELGDTLPFISSVVTDGVTIGGTGTDEDPITIIAEGFTDTNFANTNLTFTANRTHDADGFDLTIDNLVNLEFNTESLNIFGNVVRLQDNLQLRFFDADNTNYIGISSPINVTTSYNLRLPTTAGSLGEVLATDGSGNLSWITVSSSGGGLESVTGDIVDNSDPLNPVVNQIQSDWNAADAFSPEFILNKPTIPSDTDDITNNSDFIPGTTLTNALDNIDEYLKDFNVSLNFIDVEDFPLILPYQFTIDSVDNPDTLTVTITRNGSPYTLGTTINAYDDMLITVDSIGFINLNCSKISL